MQDRVPTYSEENPNGRWRKFTKDEVYSRDQLKLDFKWIVSEEDDDRTLAEMISQIKEESANIAKAVAELEKLIRGGRVMDTKALRQKSWIWLSVVNLCLKTRMTSQRPFFLSVSVLKSSKWSRTES